MEVSEQLTGFEPEDLMSWTVSNLQLVTGRQLLEVLRQSRGVLRVIAVGTHCHNVMLDSHNSLLLYRIRPKQILLLTVHLVNSCSISDETVTPRLKAGNVFPLHDAGVLTYTHIIGCTQKKISQYFIFLKFRHYVHFIEIFLVSFVRPALIQSAQINIFLLPS